jgi:carbon-monoxide dehydrogenase medium subunit
MRRRLDMGKRTGRLRRLPELECLFPKTLKEAVSLLNRHNGAAKVIAGGTDLLLQMKYRDLTPKYLVDLSGIEDLQSVTYDREKGLVIGAMVTLADVRDSSLVRKYCPILTETTGQMASEQVRSMGTMVGNLCNAVPSADSAPPLMSLRASLRLVGPKSARTVLVEDFFKGPGETVLKSNEIVKEIQIPHGRGEKGTYLKHTLRREMDLAIVGVAVCLASNPKKDLCRDIRISLGAVAPIPMRAKGAEELLRGKKFSEELIGDAALAASEEAKPIDDIRASAEYRKEMVRVLTKRALQSSLERL